MSKPNENLRSPRIKIEGAKAYIRDLEDAISAYSQSQPYRIIKEVDTKTGYNTTKVKLAQPIPEIIERKVGDIIANLRSALDQIACDLAILNRRGTSDVYFPTGESLEDFETAAERKIKKLSPSAIALIHLLEPYKGGKGERFWLIGKLEAINKHKRLVAIGHIVNDVIFNIMLTGHVAIWDPTKWDTEDESLVLYGSMEDGKVEGDFKIAFDIAFSEIESLKGESIIPFFVQLSDSIENFRKTCLNLFY